MPPQTSGEPNAGSPIGSAFFCTGRGKSFCLCQHEPNEPRGVRLGERTEKSDQTQRIEQILQQVREVVAPVLKAHSVELFDLALNVRRNAWTLQLTIDTPASSTGGVTVDMCADVSRDVSMVLDVAEPISHSYTLEVSSPGVERPLRALRDYQRFEGKLAKVVLQEPLQDGQKVIRGHLGGVQDGKVVMLPEHGRPLLLDFENIRKAKLVFEATSQKKRCATRRKKKKR